MSNDVGEMGGVMWGLVYAALLGTVAAILLMVLAEWEVSPAAFVGTLLAAVVGGLIAWVSRPLPSFTVSNREARTRAPHAAALNAAAAGAHGRDGGMTGAASAGVTTHDPVAMAAPLMAGDLSAATTYAPAVAESRPVALSGPRNGMGDNLQEIEGIGPTMEKLCHELGVYHFDQIAGWGGGEVAWMDSNMQGFRGRVTRDRWVAQARLIVTEGLPAFRDRVKTNSY